MYMPQTYADEAGQRELAQMRGETAAAAKEEFAFEDTLAWREAGYWLVRLNPSQPEAVASFHRPIQQHPAAPSTRLAAHFHACLQIKAAQAAHV